FEFEKRNQLFISVHNKAPCALAFCRPQPKIVGLHDPYFDHGSRWPLNSIGAPKESLAIGALGPALQVRPSCDANNALSKRPNRTASWCRAAPFIQQHDRSIHDFVFIPMDALQQSSDPASSIEEVDFNSMPVHERRDKIDS